MKKIIKFIKLNYKFFIKEFLRTTAIVFSILFVGTTIANTDPTPVIIGKWLGWLGISMAVAIITIIVAIISNEDDINRMDL